MKRMLQDFKRIRDKCLPGSRALPITTIVQQVQTCLVSVIIPISYALLEDI